MFSIIARGISHLVGGGYTKKGEFSFFQFLTYIAHNNVDNTVIIFCYFTVRQKFISRYCDNICLLSDFFAFLSTK